MPEPANQFQRLNRFVRDHKDEDADLLIAASEVRLLCEGIASLLKIGTDVADIARANAGLPRYVATYEELYGEPDPSKPAVIEDSAAERAS